MRSPDPEHHRALPAQQDLESRLRCVLRRHEPIEQLGIAQAPERPTSKERVEPSDNRAESTNRAFLESPVPSRQLYSASGAVSLYTFSLENINSRTTSSE